mmetsp:Transcript_26480/g.60338  ORF Transcript_26480/g.60338 Transcript_26480/m.60338 type:complete len:324 (+) Transcript_26480:673-1644(+)
MLRPRQSRLPEIELYLNTSVNSPNCVQVPRLSPNRSRLPEIELRSRYKLSAMTLVILATAFDSGVIAGVPMPHRATSSETSTSCSRCASEEKNCSHSGCFKQIPATSNESSRSCSSVLTWHMRPPMSFAASPSPRTIQSLSRLGLAKHFISNNVGTAPHVVCNNSNCVSSFKALQMSALCTPSIASDCAETDLSRRVALTIPPSFFSTALQIAFLSLCSDAFPSRRSVVTSSFNVALGKSICLLIQFCKAGRPDKEIPLSLVESNSAGSVVNMCAFSFSMLAMSYFTAKRKETQASNPHQIRPAVSPFSPNISSAPVQVCNAL